MVTIYQMEVPFNTTMYQRMKDAGKVTAPVADWATKRRWVSYAFSEFEKAGYSVSSAYTVVKDPAKAKFVYRDSLWSGADLLSFGVASFGQISGVINSAPGTYDSIQVIGNQPRLPGLIKRFPQKG